MTHRVKARLLLPDRKTAYLLLTEEDKELVAKFIINRIRGEGIHVNVIDENNTESNGIRWTNRVDLEDLESLMTAHEDVVGSVQETFHPRTIVCCLQGPFLYYKAL